MTFERMMDRSKLPTEEEIQAHIGQPVNDCWAALDRYMKETYQVELQPVFGPSYGWSTRYRKGGRPLCEILPEKGAFTVLVVLGKKEAEQAFAALDDFGPTVRVCLENTPAFHDGRWLWIRVHQPRDVEDIQRLVAYKRKPPKK